MAEFKEEAPVETGPLESVPKDRFKTLNPYEGEDYVVEGSPEAEELAAAAPPKEGPPETPEDIREQLKALESKLDFSQLGKAIGENLRPAVQPAPYQPPVPQETPEARKVKLNQRFIEDPIAAQEEANKENNLAIVQLLVNQGQTLSRELILTDPSTKTLYGKYRDEVEQEVARMPILEKAQKPRIYQTALDRVRSRHSEDEIKDQIKEGVAAALKELGIDPERLPKSANGQSRVSGGPQPRVAVPNVQGRQGASVGARPTVIPKAVEDEANRAGVDPVFYYHHLKEQGRIK